MICSGNGICGTTSAFRSCFVAFHYRESKREHCMTPVSAIPIPHLDFNPWARAYIGYDVSCRAVLVYMFMRV